MGPDRNSHVLEGAPVWHASTMSKSATMMLSPDMPRGSTPWLSGCARCLFRLAATLCRHHLRGMRNSRSPSLIACRATMPLPQPWMRTEPVSASHVCVHTYARTARSRA